MVFTSSPQVTLGLSPSQPEVSMSGEERLRRLVHHLGVGISRLYLFLRAELQRFITPTAREVSRKCNLVEYFLRNVN